MRVFTFNVYDAVTKQYLGSVRAKDFKEVDAIVAERWPGKKVDVRMSM